MTATRHLATRWHRAGMWLRRPAPSTQRVLAATLALAACAAVIALLLAGKAAPVSASSLSFPAGWVLLLAAFAFAEAVVLRLRVMQHEQTVTIAELAFALALVALTPDVLIGVRIAGALLSFVAVRRRMSLKVLFNTALWSAEAAVAAGVFSVVNSGNDGWGPHLWLALLLAVLAGPGLLSAVATTVVIGLYEGHVDAREVAVSALEQLVTSAAIVSPAVLVLDVLHGTPYGIALVLPTLVVFVAVYKYVASLHERHAALLRVHAFTHELSVTGTPESVLRVVLQQVRILLGVTHVEVSVRRPQQAEGVLAGMLDRDGSLTLRVVPAGLGVGMLPPPPHPLSGTAPRRIRRRGTSAEDAAWLTQRRLREAIIAPLPAADGPIGMLIAAAAPGEVRSFTGDDSRLLASVAEQVSVALRHAELLEQLQHASDHDPLTGLGNRDVLHRAAEARLSESVASVLSIDLDGFKEVNDAFGHAHGDAILVEVGRRLAQEFLAPAVSARLGGDEFAVLLPDADSEEAMAAAVRLRGLLEQPVVVGADVLAVGASVGVATVPRGTSPAVVLQRADLAMYAAKRSDHGPRGWEPRLEARSASRTPLLGELRRALATGDIGIALQPQIDPVGGALVSMEALVRWSLPAFGPVSPEQLVATAERGGMMTDVTLHVLDLAMAAAADLERRGRTIDVSVNLSNRDLGSDRLVPGVRLLLARHGIMPDRLTLELTETGLLEDLERSTSVLQELKRVGVRLSLDDFGTGWSTLQQVKRLPFDEIKIDRTFLGDVVSDPGAAAIVRSVLDLGSALGMRVVAEGVEDAVTLGWLAAEGCDRAQGYHIARPMPLGDLLARAGAALAQTGV